MAIYKFMASGHADALVNDGRLLLRSLDYYSHLESVHGQVGIGDRFESGSIQTQAEPIELGGLILSGNTWVHRTPHSLALCLAEGDLDDLTPIFGGEYGYDAAVEVIDPQGLSQALAEHGRAVDQELQVADLVTTARSGRVQYVEKQNDIAGGIKPPTGAFFKPPKFASQREFRICLEAADEWLADHLLIEIPEPHRYVRLVTAQWPAHPGPVPALPREPNLPEAIERLVQANMTELTEYYPWSHFHALPFLGKPRETWTEEESAAAQIARKRDAEEHQAHISDVMNRYGGPMMSLLWDARINHGVKVEHWLSYVGNGGAVATSLTALRKVLLGIDDGFPHPPRRCLGYRPL